MIALREFRYLDLQTQRAVTVKRGQTVDESRLKESRVDLEKLARVDFVGQDEAGAVTTAPPAAPKKRGRPRKY